MVNSDARQFGIYLLANVLSQLGTTTSMPEQFATNIASVVPGLDLAQFQGKRPTQDQWLNQIAPKIVDHYVRSYEPGKLRASA